MATFQTITTDKKQYLPLLLLADPCEAMIDRYLEAGDMHVLSIGDAPIPTRPANSRTSPPTPNSKSRGMPPA